MSMPTMMRKAAVIVFGEFEGGEWNWGNMRWNKRD